MGAFDFLFPSYKIVPGTTEQQALRRLEARAWDIVRRARWCNLSQSKVNELRQPLLELYLARRAIRRPQLHSSTEKP